MASVFKRPKSKYWYAGWRGPDGRFILRSTKQTERMKALTVALEWERVSKSIRKGEIAENQIRDVINDLFKRVGQASVEAPTIKQWFNEWVAEKETSKSSHTAERYKVAVDHFLKHLGDRSDKLLTVLTPRDIQSFIAMRQKLKLSSATINLDAKILRSVLTRARRQGLIAHNPAEAVDLPKKRSVERGTYTPTEIHLLFNQCKGTEWETLIMFGYYTGARLGDCTRMLWENVDLANELLTFKETKTEKEMILPLHPELQEHLSKLAAIDKPQKYITPKMAELGPGGRHGLSERFKSIVRKSGLDLQTVEGSGVRNISKRTFHALRHSFTSALANAGVSPELRMKLTGHNSAAVHKGYTHLELQTLKDAIKKLPGVVGTENAKAGK